MTKVLYPIGGNLNAKKNQIAHNDYREELRKRRLALMSTHTKKKKKRSE